MQKLTEALKTLKILKDRRIVTSHGFINSVDKVEGGWRIITSDVKGDVKPFRFMNNTLIKWVDELQYDATLAVEETIVKSNLPVITEQEKEAIQPISNLSKTLMDSIEKIKKDPNYIDQAKAINQTANVLINLTAVHLNILKQLR